LRQLSLGALLILLFILHCSSCIVHLAYCIPSAGRCYFEQETRPRGRAQAFDKFPKRLYLLNKSAPA
jgi:hypothetical protein